ncbi:MAG: hypothetical protein ACQ5SW_14245 [Sphaerochaetaceae bacterium]
MSNRVLHAHTNLEVVEVSHHLLEGALSEAAEYITNHPQDVVISPPSITFDPDAGTWDVYLTVDREFFDAD